MGIWEKKYIIYVLRFFVYECVAKPVPRGINNYADKSKTGLYRYGQGIRNCVNGIWPYIFNLSKYANNGMDLFFSYAPFLFDYGYFIWGKREKKIKAYF